MGTILTHAASIGSGPSRLAETACRGDNPDVTGTAPRRVPLASPARSNRTSIERCITSHFARPRTTLPGCPRYDACTGAFAPGAGLAAGDVGNDDVGGVSVEVLAASVVDRRGSGVG